MITTIIFDFDGTLADTLPFMRDRMLRLIKEAKATDLPDNEIIEKIKAKSYPELMKEFKISWLKLPFILAKVYQAQMDLYNEINKIKLFPGIRKLLGRLDEKGYRLGIVSSNMKENIKKFLEVKRLTVFFEFVYCEKNIFGKEKAIRHMLTDRGLKKTEIVYIGDEVRDIEAARKAGVKIISVSWGFNSKENLQKYQPDFLAGTAGDIEEYLKNPHYCQVGSRRA